MTAPERPDGGMIIRVDGQARAQVQLRRFYFPHWRIRDVDSRAVRIKPHPRQHVVTFDAPAG